MRWYHMFVYVPPAACVIFAGLGALNGVEGWGWFLLVALILGSVSWSNGDKA